MADQCSPDGFYIAIGILCVLVILLCGVLIFCICKLRRRPNGYTSILGGGHGNGNEDEVQKFKDFYEEERRKKESAIHKVEVLTDMYNDEKREKEDALQRLSKIMSDRLTDGNPNIANLNDVKRPTKLAEELSELYDNEWTGAFESIQKGEDKKKIGLLLQILEISFGWSKMHANGQMQKMKNLLVCPDMSDTKTVADVSVNLDVMKRFKDERKILAEKTVVYVSEKVLTEVKDTFKGSEWETEVSLKPVEAYCKKCAELCWYVAIQDPPMDMKFSDMKLDDLKAYTQSGKEMEYVVWPPLYLHEKGSLISKGIAQFRTSN